MADADQVAIVGGGRRRAANAAADRGGRLLELVRSGDAVAKAYAAAALATVAINDANRVAIAEAGAIAPLSSWCAAAARTPRRRRRWR